MSRIKSCSPVDDCKPWLAPKLEMSDTGHFALNKNRQAADIHNRQQELTRQQSYERSYAKGYMEGLEKGQQEINGQIAYLNSMIAALAMPLPELDEQVVDELMQLCMIVVRQMIRRELKTSPDEVVAVVREALSLLPTEERAITIELHPDDAKLIRDTVMPAASESSWNIIEDPLLTRGGCRVLTAASRIDATVEKRMNAVVAEVMGGARKADDAQ